MKKTSKTQTDDDARGSGTYVSSVRLDRALAFDARAVALENKRAGREHDSLTKILNRALADFLKRERGTMRKAS